MPGSGHPPAVTPAWDRLPGSDRAARVSCLGEPLRLTQASWPPQQTEHFPEGPSGPATGLFALPTLERTSTGARLYR